jgi:O-antigen ligase
VLIPSISTDSLINGTQSGKTFLFLLGIGAISILAVIRFCLDLENENKNLSPIDLLFFILIMYLLFQNNWVELSHSLLFLELIGLTILYIIIRHKTTQIYFWIFIALIIGGLIQAVYGNLQLWGYFSSHHGIFKMTGSFFNPGPYSGYLAAIFPISLGFYLFNSSFNPIIARPFNFIKISLFNTIKSFFTKVFCTHFFYNNNEEKSSSEKLKSSTKPTDYITMKSFFLISIISMCLVLPASRSRAAWLAIAVSSVYLLSIKYKLVQQVKAHFKTRIRRISLLVSLVVLLFIIGAGLYHLKKGSADGRLLIWKVSTEMIKDKPLFGHGYDGFKKHYMDYQAKYFQRNPESKEAMVAGDTNYAFNELIQLTVENGIIGILPFFAIIFFVIFGKVKTLRSGESEEKPVHSNDRLSLLLNSASVEQNDSEIDLIHISRAVILSILVFGLFSYPLQILPIKICLTVALALTARLISRKVYINFLIPIRLNRSLQFTLKSIVSIGFLGLLWIAIIQIKLVETAYSNWKNAFNLYNMGLYDDCLANYEEAYPILKTNGDFLTNYGKALSMAEKHAEAVDILILASKYYPNTIVYTALGDCYKKLGQTSNAEQAYLHAWHMNPSRLYPKYLLAKLYDETGQKTKAIEVAKELLEKDIKIESTAIEEIRDEMEKLTEKNASQTMLKTKNKPTISQTQ